MKKILKSVFLLFPLMCSCNNLIEVKKDQIIEVVKKIVDRYSDFSLIEENLIYKQIIEDNGVTKKHQVAWDKKDGLFYEAELDPNDENNKIQKWYYIEENKLIKLENNKGNKTKSIIKDDCSDDYFKEQLNSYPQSNINIFDEVMNSKNISEEHYFYKHKKYFKSSIKFNNNKNEIYLDFTDDKIVEFHIYEETKKETINYEYGDFHTEVNKDDYK